MPAPSNLSAPASSGSSSSVTRLLTDPHEYARRQLDENPYGDGQAAGRIVDIMLKQGWKQ